MSSGLHKDKQRPPFDEWQLPVSKVAIGAVAFLMLFNNEIISDIDNTVSTVLLFAVHWFNIHLIFYTESCFIKTLCIHFKLIRARIAVVGFEGRQESLPIILVSSNCLGSEHRQSFKRNYNIFQIICCHSSLWAVKVWKSLQFKFIQHNEYTFSVHESAGLDWTKMEYRNLQ